jgi:hypothetical protein
MATNVIARIYLKTRECVVRDKTDPNTRPGKEGMQWHQLWKCKTRTIDKNDWNWRYYMAKRILCEGEVGDISYYGQVIGGEYTIEMGLADQKTNTTVTDAEVG